MNRLDGLGGVQDVNAYVKSNQIILIGLRSSKNYYKRAGGCVGIWEGSLGCEFFAWVTVC